METLCDVLKIISMGISRPTRIMYKANLSWAKLQQAVETLERFNMVSKQSEGRHLHFNLTSKGIFVLKTYNEVMAAFGRLWPTETLLQ